MRGAGVALWITEQQWRTHTVWSRVLTTVTPPFVVRLSDTYVSPSFPQVHTRTDTRKPICISWINTFTPHCSHDCECFPLLLTEVRGGGFHSNSSRQSEDNTSYFGFALISNRQLINLIRSYQPRADTQIHTCTHKRRWSKIISLPYSQQLSLNVIICVYWLMSLYEYA